jgi:hypothetical protein
MPGGGAMNWSSLLVGLMLATVLFDIGMRSFGIGMAIILFVLWIQWRVIRSRQCDTAEKRARFVSMVCTILALAGTVAERDFSNLRHLDASALGSYYRVVDLPRNQSGGLSAESITLMIEAFSGVHGEAFLWGNYDTLNATDIKIEQQGAVIKTSFTVNPLTRPFRVRELGDQLVRLIKSWNGLETPAGWKIGKGNFDYELVVKNENHEVVGTATKMAQEEELLWK